MHTSLLLDNQNFHVRAEEYHVGYLWLYPTDGSSWVLIWAVHYFMIVFEFEILVGHSEHDFGLFCVSLA